MCERLCAGTERRNSDNSKVSSIASHPTHISYTELTNNIHVKAHASSPAEFSALGQEAEQVADCAEAVWSGMFSYRATMKAEALQKRWKGHRVLETPHVVRVPCSIADTTAGELKRWHE